MLHKIIELVISLLTKAVYMTNKAILFISHLNNRYFLEAETLPFTKHTSLKGNLLTYVFDLGPIGGYSRFALGSAFISLNNDPQYLAFKHKTVLVSLEHNGDVISLAKHIIITEFTTVDQFIDHFHNKLKGIPGDPYKAILSNASVLYIKVFIKPNKV